MHFFLKNLSVLDVFLVSVTIPKFAVNSLTHTNSISVLGCDFQLLLVTSFSAGEIFVLTTMSYERYVAICRPLHYEAIMNDGACVWGAVSVTIPKFAVNSLTHTNSISVLGCDFQLLLVTSFSAGEIFVLTAMSYDRYVAICRPLHYEAIMNDGACVWGAGTINEYE
ncbi:Olfactory receptor 14A2 [Tupaia chinensis]|uniref:Olfactory receptor 14A2 n=1 Tax=Tupaia chinensis TaxID=246437 RepID=L9KT80_TUPCH|nr:Olfactory receptor 14A2 [Tupaia chinensis]